MKLYKYNKFEEISKRQKIELLKAGFTNTSRESQLEWDNHIVQVSLTGQVAVDGKILDKTIDEIREYIEKTLIEKYGFTKGRYHHQLEDSLYYVGDIENDTNAEYLFIKDSEEPELIYPDYIIHNAYDIRYITMIQLYLKLKSGKDPFELPSDWKTSHW